MPYLVSRGGFCALKMADGNSTKTDTRRLQAKKQTLGEAYATPDDILEIEISDPQVHGFAKNRYTDYELRIKVSHSSCVHAVLCVKLFSCLKPFSPFADQHSHF